MIGHSPIAAGRPVRSRRERHGALPLFALMAVVMMALVSCTPKRFTMNQLAEREGSHAFYNGTFRRLDDLFRHASHAGNVPAGAVLVARGGTPVYGTSWGRTLPDGGGEAVTTATLFDVASLTKPLAGVPIALILAEDPATSEAERRAIGRVMRHTIGMDDTLHFPNLAGVEPLFKQGNSKPLYRYANANYVYLSLRATGRLPGARAELAEAYWLPLGVSRMTWKPRPDQPVVWSGRDDSGAPIWGMPFDPLAAGMRVNGYEYALHSGLFANAEETARFASQLLRREHTTRWMDSLEATLFGDPEFIPLADDQTRSIWLTPGGMISAVGRPYAFDGAAPGRFLYHTGYTGCLLWVDLRTETVVAFLSNAAAVDEREEWRVLSERLVQILISGTDRQYSAPEGPERP